MSTPRVILARRVWTLRNLQSRVEISVDKNSTVVFPAPLMSTIEELGSFLRRETEAAGLEWGAVQFATKLSLGRGASPGCDQP